MMINAVAVVQEFYRAMGAGDVEHIAALLSPELDGQGQNASRTTAVCGGVASGHR
jgi:hypothetical protein